MIYKARVKRAKQGRHYPDAYTRDLTNGLYDHLSHIKTIIKTEGGNCITVNKYGYRSSKYLETIYAGELPLPYVIDFADLLEKGFLDGLLNARHKDHVLTRTIQQILNDANRVPHGPMKKTIIMSADDWIVS
jgi:hypothetical protein